MVRARQSSVVCGFHNPLQTRFERFRTMMSGVTIVGLSGENLN
jgi:hypothetical protein